MGQLVMAFRGICMHLSRASVSTLPVAHRVVAVNAGDGFASTLFGPLPPHRAFLMMDRELAERFAQAGLPPDEDGNILLTGARIDVVNATGKPLTACIADIPSLKDFVPQMRLRSELAGAGVPETADSFVEMTHGWVDERFFTEGGIYSTWTVKTQDDPTIRITQNGLTVTVTVPSTDEPSIVLKNGTTNSADKKFDFALHYLAAVGGIDEQHYAKPFPIDPDSGSSFGVDTSSSCSNSQYP